MQALMELGNVIRKLIFIVIFIGYGAWLFCTVVKHGKYLKPMCCSNIASVTMALWSIYATANRVSVDFDCGFLRKPTRDVIVNIFLRKAFFISARLNFISANKIVFPRGYIVIPLGQTVFPQGLFDFHMVYFISAWLYFCTRFISFPQCYVHNLAQIKLTWWKWYLFTKIHFDLVKIQCNVTEIQLGLAEIQFDLAEM